MRPFAIAVTVLLVAPLAAAAFPAPDVCGADGSPACVPFRTLAVGLWSYLDVGSYYVSTPVEWQSLWTQHDSAAPRPAVDFAREFVVGLVHVHTNCCEKLHVTEVVHAGAQVYVVNYEHAPHGGDDVHSRPYSFAAVTRAPGEGAPIAVFPGVPLILDNEFDNWV